MRLRLGCDACDYISDLVELSAKYIGKPCPNCGANLLTAEDHAAAVKYAENPMNHAAASMVGSALFPEAEKIGARIRASGIEIKGYPKEKKH